MQLTTGLLRAAYDRLDGQLMEGHLEALEARLIAHVARRLADLESRLLGWIFVCWVLSLAFIVGILFTIRRT